MSGGRSLRWARGVTAMAAVLVLASGAATAQGQALALPLAVADGADQQAPELVAQEQQLREALAKQKE